MGTADIHFHRERVALAGSDRTNEPTRGVFAELRLAFHAVDEPHRLHEPHIARKEDILRALRSGERDRAETLPAGCPDDSLERMAEVYRRRAGTAEQGV
ncbi:hypothetical protein [Streptomyces sp. NEAU-W12]|uniref:hypothetical protein n=1 Tax=Streptomyces sp. NEAU-W12 TaxID=2994668 RepID=UPI003A4C7E35